MQTMEAEISAADSSIFLALSPSLNSLSSHIAALSAHVPGSRLASENQPERCAFADNAISVQSAVPTQVDAVPCVFCCECLCSCPVASVHAHASVHASLPLFMPQYNNDMHVPQLNAPAGFTGPLISVASDGTHLTSNQMNRIALNKAKAIEIKKARRLAAHSSLPRADISATPEELAPVSMHMHGGATSHFRRRFWFGGVSAAVAVARTRNQKRRAPQFPCSYMGVRPNFAGECKAPRHFFFQFFLFCLSLHLGYDSM